jgi:hypothetical protein
VTRELEHVEVADQVRVNVGVRVFDRIADAGLGAEMDDLVEPLAGGGRGQRRIVGKIDLQERETVVPPVQLRKAIAFQLGAVIIVDVVEPDHLLAPGHEALAHVKANEAGGAGHECGHRFCLTRMRSGAP